MKVALLLPALLLGACATHSGEPLAPDGERGEFKASMPYIRFKVDDGGKCAPVTADTKLNSQLGSYYIRLGAIYSSEGTPASMSYDDRTRPAIIRALWSTNASFSLSAIISVDSQPAYSNVTVPLYVVSHESGQKGESFATNLEMMWQNTFIKVQPGSTINLQFEGKVSDKVETAALSAGLRVAKVAVGAIAPEAKVLTTLNQNRLQTEAKLWDTALGQLFSQNASETIRVITSPSQVNNKSCGTLTVYAPGQAETLDPTRKIGEWKVGINDWRRSLFSENACLLRGLTPQCAKTVINELTPARVLSEPVGAGKTVATYLKDEDVVGVATTKAAKDARNPDATTFCRKLNNALVTLGLTDIDARIGLWAYISGQPLPGDSATTLARNDECKAIIKPFSFGGADTQTTQNTDAPG